MADTWDDAAQARFDERNPPLCSFCEEPEAGPDGLCNRCSENADSIENNSDVAELVRAARASLGIGNYTHSALSAALDHFPLTDREQRDARWRRPSQEAL